MFGRRKTWGLVVLLLGTMATGSLLTSCSTSSLLSLKDKNDFVKASNAFIGANNKFQTKAQTETDLSLIASQAGDAIKTMNDELGKMEKIVTKLKGNPRKIGDSAVAAAKQLLKATEDLKTAAQASDVNGLLASGNAITDAVSKFNEQATKWNAQKAK